MIPMILKNVNDDRLDGVERVLNPFVVFVNCSSKLFGVVLQMDEIVVSDFEEDGGLPQEDGFGEF